MNRTTLLPHDAVNPPTSRPPDSDEGRASSQGSSPPAALVASLADHYVIERELGQGGMATVYLAHDVKHDRSVALKVLRPELAAVLGADRFVQEIKTTANLSHPNILPLFDSGTADGFLYYVMPFVDGETLRDKLNRETQFAVEEAVRITADIAEALDYAHRHEVIHRDIKPENILLHDGRPMVADFGIALAVSAAAGGRMTETGLSLGTPHYMSPEQATAEKDITARSDVYSLGCMLYEMLTGNPPHIGASAYQIIMKIVTEEAAPVTNLRKSVPPYVAATVAKALEKLPADRFASAHDFAEALLGHAAVIAPDGSAAALGTTTIRGASATSTAAPPRLKDPVVLGLGVVTVASLAFALVPRGGEQAVEVPPIRYVVDTPDSVRAVDNFPWPGAISPDGSTVVYSVGRRGVSVQLYSLHTDQLDPRPIPGTEGGYQPYFSPDGKWLAFEAAGKEKKVRLDGSAPVNITDASSANGACWTARNEIILGAAGDYHGLSWVSAAGGEAAPLTEPDTASGVQEHVFPIGAGDGRTIVFSLWAGSLATERLAATDRADGKVVPLGIMGVRALAVLDGMLVYVQADGQVMAVPFDVGAKKVTGKPIPVADPVGVPSATNGNAGIYISTRGALLEARGFSRARLVWLSGDKRPQLVIPDPQSMFNPQLSPDEGKIVVTVGDNQKSDAWIKDLRLNTFAPITSLGAVQSATWTPDGKNLLFTGPTADGQGGVWEQPAAGGSPPRLLFSRSNQIPTADMSPDGKWLALTTLGAGSTWDVLAVRLDSVPVAKEYLATRAQERAPRFSPDGKWVAVVSDESGQDEVYLRSFPDPSSKVPVSVSGGSEPVWARDGSGLYYRVGGQILKANIRLEPTLTLVSRDTVVSTAGFQGAGYFGASYDVPRDGKRLLALQSDADDFQIVVSPNWITELRRKVAENSVSR